MPVPSVLSRLIVPAFSSMIWRAIDIPSPVPAMPLAVALRARK